MWYILLFLFLMAAAEALSENSWLILIAIAIAVFSFIFKSKHNKEIPAQLPIQNVQSSPLSINTDYDNLDGHHFEVYCAELLKKNNFSHVSVTKGSGDFGVDILAEKDGWKYAIQCKNYSSKVGNHAVQEVYSGKDFYNADIAVVITNNYFTPAAIETADNLDVELWDRDNLNDMISKSAIFHAQPSVTIKSVGKVSKQVEDNFKEIDTNDIISLENAEIQNVTVQVREITTMYDEKNGIYPSGEYIIGEDLPVGKYLLKQRENSTNGEIHIYKDYQTYLKNPDNELIFKFFKGDYHLSLQTEGNLLVVENADIQKI